MQDLPSQHSSVQSALVGVNCCFNPISQPQACNYVICIIVHATPSKGLNLARNPSSRSARRFSRISTLHLTVGQQPWISTKVLLSLLASAVLVSSQFLTHESDLFLATVFVSQYSK